MDAVTSRDTVTHALSDRAASVKALLDADFTVFDTAELLAIQSEREQRARADEAIDHRIQAALTVRATPHEIGGKSWTDVLATRMRISRREAARRVAAAADLGPRHLIGGEVLEPVLPACAHALAAGTITTGHITIIGATVKKTSAYTNAGDRAQLESTLVHIATTNTPDTLQKAADHALYLLNQDGASPEGVRHRRGLIIGAQDPDGLTRIHGWVDPEFAAYLGVIRDVCARPGINNPDDPPPRHNPVPNPLEEDPEAPADGGGEPGPVEEVPFLRDTEQQRRDLRTDTQRTHDAIKAVLRDTLMSTRLGQYNGLPVTVVVSTTLAELEAAAGIAVTGSGTLMPMPDLIRLAEHAHHYLVVYREHTAEPLYLGRTKRLATKAQRLLLYHRDRGCTRPGCTHAAYRCQAHHAQPSWKNGGLTDAPTLGLGCGPDNRLAEMGWTTRIDPVTGRVHWHPPPLMDTGQDTLNHHFHPEELFPPKETD